MKNAISNLFSVKEIMDNIKKEPNENQSYEMNKTEHKNPKRPMTVHTNKKTNIETNPFKQDNSNIGSIIKEEVEIKKPKTGHHLSVDSKKDNQEKKIYNTTINTVGQNIPKINNNTINKKSSSSNKKDVIYYIRANKDNGKKGNQRAFSSMKKDDAKSFEDIFNNLKSYIPKNDLNMNENNNFFKKK